MLLRFGYLYTFFYVLFLFFQKAENNRLKKNPVGQNFVTYFFVFAQNMVGWARRPTN